MCWTGYQTKTSNNLLNIGYNDEYLGGRGGILSIIQGTVEPRLTEISVNRAEI